LDLVAAEQAQFLGKGIVWGEGAPSVAVRTQGVGKAQGIEAVVLAAGVALALAVTLGSLWLQRLEHAAHGRQSLNGRAVIGLDGHGQTARVKAQAPTQALAQVPPALSLIGKGKLQEKLARPVEHDEVVMIAGPVKTGKSEESFLEWHLLLVGIGWHVRVSMSGPTPTCVRST
jgi:hypothetical protein